MATRESLPTGVAVDRLLEALAVLDRRDGASEELMRGILVAIPWAANRGAIDLAEMWAAFGGQAAHVVFAEQIKAQNRELRELRQVLSNLRKDVKTGAAEGTAFGAEKGTEKGAAKGMRDRDSSTATMVRTQPRPMTRRGKNR